MRALAMTGIVTASWISVILSGSAIRATPPCARMSAGTRSSAITATAPASSAISACSDVVTSMITPPLSISARPPSTRMVPSSAIGFILATDDKVVSPPALGPDGPAVEAIRTDDEVDESVLRQPTSPARIARRAGDDRVQTRVPAAVDDVADTAFRAEPLVVVVVTREGEDDAVTLEEGHPAAHDLGMRAVVAAGVGRVMEDGDLPVGLRGGKAPCEPGRLGRVDPVRVEEEQLRGPGRLLVVAPAHAEGRELVPSSLDTGVMVAEHAGDGEAPTTGPAEAPGPVGAKRRGALRVVVVAERQEQVRAVARLEPAHALAEAPLELAADSEVADRDDPVLAPRLRPAGSRQEHRQADEQDSGEAHLGRCSSPPSPRPRDDSSTETSRSAGAGLRTAAFGACDGGFPQPYVPPFVSAGVTEKIVGASRQSHHPPNGRFSPAGSGARRREAEHHALRRQLLERRAEESSLGEPVDHLGLAGTQVSVRERRLLREGSRELAAEEALEVPALEVHGKCLRRLALTAGDRWEERDDRLDVGQELEGVEGELDRLAAQQHQALRCRLAGERAVLLTGEAAEAEQRRLAGLDDRDVALGELPVTTVAERDVLEGEAGDLAGLRRDGYELLAVRAAVLTSDLGRDLARPLEAALLGGQAAGCCRGAGVVAAAHEADGQQRGEDHHDDHRIADHEAPAVNSRLALEARQCLLRLGCLLA